MVEVVRETLDVGGETVRFGLQTTALVEGDGLGDAGEGGGAVAEPSARSGAEVLVPGSALETVVGDQALLEGLELLVDAPDLRKHLADLLVVSALLVHLLGEMDELLAKERLVLLKALGRYAERMDRISQLTEPRGMAGAEGNAELLGGELLDVGEVLGEFVRSRPH